ARGGDGRIEAARKPVAEHGSVPDRPIHGSELPGAVGHPEAEDHRPGPDRREPLRGRAGSRLGERTTLGPLPRLRRVLPQHPHRAKQASRGPRVAGPPPPASPGTPPDIPTPRSRLRGDPGSRDPLPRLRRVLPRLRGGESASPGFAGYSPDFAGPPPPASPGREPFWRVSATMATMLVIALGVLT